MKNDRKTAQAAASKAYRERRKAAGMIKAQIWVHPDDAHELHDLAREMNRERGL